MPVVMSSQDSWKSNKPDTQVSSKADNRRGILAAKYLAQAAERELDVRRVMCEEHRAAEIRRQDNVVENAVFRDLVLPLLWVVFAMALVAFVAVRCAP